MATFESEVRSITPQSVSISQVGILNRSTVEESEIEGTTSGRQDGLGVPASVTRSSLALELGRVDSSPATVGTFLLSLLLRGGAGNGLGRRTDACCFA